MKVNEICKVGFSRPVFNDVIDCRGFVKTPPYNMLAGKPLNNAQTACSSCNLVADKPLDNAKMVRPEVSGQVEKGRLTASVYPLKPSIK